MYVRMPRKFKFKVPSDGSAIYSAAFLFRRKWLGSPGPAESPVNCESAAFDRGSKSKFR